ncbi:MAG: hypothetical protein Q8Q59_13840 [Luteolibacter sp.]|nr:hypothetical protein [Luteolibacter sp.]
MNLLAATLICAGSAQAQLAASLQIAKKQHLAGEAVIAVVTVTNHSGRDLVFQSDGRFQWLDFIVKKSNGNPVTPRNRVLFGPMKITAGQTLAREIDLSQHFQLSEPGNFSVSAVIQPPGDPASSTSTNRVFFNQTPGRPYWSQKVGVSGSTREFRVLNFTGDTKSLIYAQIVDGATGQFVRTFQLGEVLMLRKPLVTVDRQQRMHVMFLATPTMWVHCMIDTDGKLVDRQIHQRGPQGDPQLLTFADGSVRVANSIPYDPKAAAEARARIRKASDRPTITYD